MKDLYFGFVCGLLTIVVVLVHTHYNRRFYHQKCEDAGFIILSKEYYDCITYLRKF